ncbi:MAG: sigma 54-interacting transcriptional regulator [Verrucomicrobiota bacterium]
MSATKSNNSPIIIANNAEHASQIGSWLPEDWDSMKAGIVCVSNNATIGDPNFDLPQSHSLVRWIIIFDSIPIDPTAVQNWRDWAMNEDAIDIKLAMIPSGEVTEDVLEKILDEQCADWRKPVAEREDPAMTIRSRVQLADGPTPKDDSSLLTMMFGSMGDLLTQLEIIAKRFRTACYESGFNNEKQKKIRAEVEKRLAADNKEQGGFPAFETGLEDLIDHFPKILLHGESGVGKTLIASYLQSRAALWEEAQRPLRIPIPEYLGKEDSLEYDLFGYAKGTYTGGLPDGSPGKLMSNVGGVIFLDEIGEANFTIQSKLLAFLDDYRVGPRGWHGEKFHCPVLIVAATNKNLKEMAAEDEFKGDLLARFTDHLTIPPLRDRMVDIEFILDCLLQRESLNPGGHVTEIGVGALEAIRNRKFENGNFRELEDWFREACAQARREDRNYLVALDVEREAAIR